MKKIKNIGQRGRPRNRRGSISIKEHIFFNILFNIICILYLGLIFWGQSILRPFIIIIILNIIDDFIILDNYVENDEN